MKRFLLSTVSAALSFGMVSPAFAYIIKNESIEVQTSPYHDGRPSRRIIMSRFGHTDNRPTVQGTLTSQPTNVGGVHARVRSAAVDDTTGRQNLVRSTLRRVRRLNRMPKANSDRYRILDLRPNNRSLREDARRTIQVQEGSYLPSVLVKTGANTTYDRPTRRDIIKNSILNNLSRDILTEVKSSTVSN